MLTKSRGQCPRATSFPFQKCSEDDDMSLSSSPSVALDSPSTDRLKSAGPVVVGKMKKKSKRKKQNVSKRWPARGVAALRCHPVAAHQAFPPKGREPGKARQGNESCSSSDSA